MLEVTNNLPQVTILGLANADLQIVPTVIYFSLNYKKSLFVRSQI